MPSRAGQVFEQKIAKIAKRVQIMDPLSHMLGCTTAFRLVKVALWTGNRSQWDNLNRIVDAVAGVGGG